MNYTKPEITSLASASKVIQIQGQAKTPNNQDTSHTYQTSPAAYEADE